VTDDFPPLDKALDINFPHADGAPLTTLENVEALLDAYRIVIARPLLNADDFAPFFGERYHASCGEHVRDCHRARLQGLCVLNDMNITADAVGRYCQLLGLNIEDQERRAANAKRLRAGGAE
jgi:hypothetical protein